MLNVVVIAEDHSDAEIVCGLADRIFEELGSVTFENLPSYRNWIGFDPNTSFIKKSHISVLFDRLKASSKRPRFLGYVKGEPKGSYTAFWRKAVELVVAMGKSQLITGVLIHCDVDGKPEQRKDIEQACGHWLRSVLAMPNREMEAWLLNGFDAQNSSEQKRFAESKRNLAFDPCKDAHRAQDTSGERDPKNIIKALTDGDEDRKRSCWLKTDLSTLRQRGEETNLAHFLRDIEANFLPLLSG